MLFCYTVTFPQHEQSVFSYQQVQPRDCRNA